MRSVFSKILLATLLLASANLLAAQTNDNEEWGLASYYADEFQGRETAYGVKYDKGKLTAAHKRHPYGTKLRVPRLDNNKSVVVTVIDKGPYIKGRVVDLSKTAAERLGIVKDGVAEVKVEVVGRPDKQAQPAPKKEERTAATPTPAQRPSSYEDTSGSRVAETAKPSATEKETKSAAKTSQSSTAKDTPKGTSKTARPRLVGKDFQQYGLYRIRLERPADQGFAVQVASLTNYENVFRQVADLQAKWFDNILVSIEKGTAKPIYKVLLGPFESEAAAENYRKDLQAKHKVKGFVVNLKDIEY